MRDVLVHVDITANDGGAVERALRAGLGDGWMRFDPTESYGQVLPPGPLERAIADRPEIVAISSRSARPPFEPIPEVTLHPVVVLQNPFRRAAKVFASTVRDGATFAQFVERELSAGPASTIADWQTAVLAGSSDAGYERALSFLQTTRAVGAVERGSDSARAFASAFGSIFPQLRWHDLESDVEANAAADAPEFRASLGDDLYSWLIAVNQGDLRLHRYAVRRLAGDHSVLTV